MPELDVPALCEPISADHPCGEDLEYAPAFLELERLVKTEAEGLVEGREIQEPDWPAARKTAVGLLERTRDLRVAVHLARAGLAVDGLAALAEALALAKAWLENYWEQVHPILDPDDGDPTQRLNTLSQLNDLTMFVAPVRAAVLVRSRPIGQFSLRDILIARGDIAPAGDGAPPPAETSVIDAAFAEVDVQQLQTTAKAIDNAVASVASIVSNVDRRLGAGNGISLEHLEAVLGQARQELANQLEKRGYAAAGNGAASPASSNQPANAVAPAPAAAPGEIRSRQDVLTALDRICRYYADHEPSSPVPLLLKRAQRLVPKSFVDVIRDMTPDAFEQIRLIGGLSEDESEG